MRTKTDDERKERKTNPKTTDYLIKYTGRNINLLDSHFYDSQKLAISLREYDIEPFVLAVEIVLFGWACMNLIASAIVLYHTDPQNHS